MAEQASTVRIPEPAVRAKYGVALAAIKRAEVPVAGSGAGNASASPVGRVGYVAPLPGTAGARIRRERSDLAAALRGGAEDPLMAPSRHGVLVAVRRAVAVGMVVGELFAEPLDYLALGERNGKNLLGAAERDRFTALVRAKGLVTVHVAAAHLSAALGQHPPAKDGEAPPVPSTGTNDAIAWLVGLLAAAVRGVADDKEMLAQASQACFDAMGRTRADALRLPDGILTGFERTTYALEEDHFRLRGLERPSGAAAVASVEVQIKRPEEVVGNHVAKAQAQRLARMLACHDFARGRNPFVEIGGFTFTIMGDGQPGTGKTTLIQMTVGLVKGYCDIFGYPFRYENFGVDQISEYQGRSGANCRGFVDRVLDPGAIGFGTIDDVDQVAGKRDDRRASAGQQEVTAVLMEALAGAGTIVRGNAAFAMFSNFPENVDDALRQRAGARWLVDGPQTRDDYVDILALLLGKAAIPLGNHQLHAAQALKKMVAESYAKHALPQEAGLRAVWDAHVGAGKTLDTLAALGGYLHAIKEADPRFTGRAIKNITDAVKARVMDVDLPDEWFGSPEPFARKPYEEKVAMLAALRRPVTVDMVVQEINRYGDSEFRYANKSDEAEIARLLREARLREAVARRLAESGR